MLSGEQCKEELKRILNKSGLTSAEKAGTVRCVRAMVHCLAISDRDSRQSVLRDLPSEVNELRARFWEMCELIFECTQEGKVYPKENLCEYLTTIQKFMDRLMDFLHRNSVESRTLCVDLPSFACAMQFFYCGVINRCKYGDLQEVLRG